MARSMTGAVQTELDAGSVRPIFLIDADFSLGHIRFWSGVGPLTWNSVVFTGSGDLINMSAAKESSGLVANGISVSLSGIPSSLIATALVDFPNSQGRSFTCYFGFLTSAGVPIVDPFVLWAGRMDTMVIDEGVETATITVNCESRAIAFRRSNVFRLTNEQQQLSYPGDRGLEFVAGLQEFEALWANP